MDTMQVFVEPVTREALLETVGAGTIVTDDVLTRSVSELRKLFGDDPRAGRVIETLPKVGYRLVALIHDVEEGRRPMSFDTLNELILTCRSGSTTAS